MAIRKSVTSLTAEEKQKFVQGVKALKADGRYDQFVNIHNNAINRPAPAPGETPNPGTRNAAHRGPAFLPWHREFILRFEQALQSAIGDTNFGLPYWDWAADAALSNPADPNQAVIWRDDFLGGQGVPVMTGPFQQGEWTIVPSGNLEREFGVHANSLPTQADLNAALLTNVYDTTPWNASSVGSFRNLLEGWLPSPGPRTHNRVHEWVGGSMRPGTSPNDPVFFLHHCNVDRIWALWQICNPGVPYAPFDTVADAPPGHRLNDHMWPWEASTDHTIQQLLDFNALGFSYEDFHRRFIRLRRTTGNRFVSDQIIQVSDNCSTQDDTAATIFLPAASGGRIRARFAKSATETLSDEVAVS